LAGLLKDYFKKHHEKHGHFSGVLLHVNEFCSRARVSIDGPFESFFETLFSYLDESKEKRFDTMCKIIVANVIDCFCKASAKKNKRFRFYEFVYLWYTNSKTFDKCVKDYGVTGTFEVDRLGMVAVTQTIQDILVKAMQEGVSYLVKKDNQDKNDESSSNIAPARNIKAEVNQFFGWAIFKVWRWYRKRLKSHLTKQHCPANNDDESDQGGFDGTERKAIYQQFLLSVHNDDNDDSDSDSEYDSDSDSESDPDWDVESEPLEVEDDELESTIAFLDNMFIRHWEAMQDEDYRKNYYDEFFMIYNSGGLTLVSKEYFEFGKILLETIANSMTQPTIVEEGNAFMEEAWKRVAEETDKLWNAFEKCDTETTLVEHIRKDIFRALVRKTRNARNQKEINAYKNVNVRRKGKDHVGQGLRPSMDKDSQK
jgi:hypothetical protein